MTAKKLPKRLLKQATRVAHDLLDNKPETTFTSLLLAADEMEHGSDERKLAEAVLSVLEAHRDAAIAEKHRLVTDLNRLGLSHLDDGGSALENMPEAVARNSRCIAHESMFANHMRNVVAVKAEDDGIDINAKLGYAIY